MSHRHYWSSIYIFQVETIGDAYMVVAGVPEVTENHAYHMANMALGMIEASGEVVSPASKKPIQVCVCLWYLYLLCRPFAWVFLTTCLTEWLVSMLVALKASFIGLHWSVLSQRLPRGPMVGQTRHAIWEDGWLWMTGWMLDGYYNNSFHVTCQDNFFNLGIILKQVDQLGPHCMLVS